VGSIICKPYKRKYGHIQFYFAIGNTSRYRSFGFPLNLALYSNASGANLDEDSTLTTSFFLSNSSKPISYTRQPSTSFSAPQLDQLDELQIPDFTEFLTSLYWAVNLDLGQFSPFNIFTNPDLLSAATEIFHDNAFINDTFQNTPLGSGVIPPDGYAAYMNDTDPVNQTSAFLSGQYDCYQWVRKPLLSALIDVVVPSVVLLVLICFLIYAAFLACFPYNRSGPGICLEYDKLSLTARSQFKLVPTGPFRRGTIGNESLQDPFDNPAEFGEDGYFIPQPIVNTSGRSSDHYSTDELNLIAAPYENRRPSVQIPLRNPTPSFSHSQDRQPPGPSRSGTDVHTIHSEQSILQTPADAVRPGPEEPYGPDSPQTAAVFEAHARIMQEEEKARYGEGTGGSTPPVPPRRLSQHRSSTDLRRMGAVK
jgi:hypothetical protein